jgi:hypothetical protein
VADIDTSLKFHDFRMVSGHSHTNLIFDVVYSYGCKLKEDEILKAIEDRIEKLSKADNVQYFAVVKIDYPKT